jgi:protein arginine kinase
MALLSAIRLGINLKLVPGIRMGDVNELFVITQPGHLQALKGRELPPDDRDTVRASLLRERFKPEST